MAVLTFIDCLGEVQKGESLTAYFSLKGTEEFLLDHFPGFPVMPGVLQLECVRQAASTLLSQTRESAAAGAYRFNRIFGVRFGQFVRPGALLKIFVRLLRNEEEGFIFEGRIDLVENDRPKGRVLVADFSMVPTC